MLSKKEVVKSVYFSNWADQFGYTLAYWLLPYASKVSWLTPNVITVISFLTYTFGCISLFLSYPLHNIIAGFCIFAGYIGDDLDGQVARNRNLKSNFGDFLDKALDVLKIFLLTGSLGTAVAIQTGNAFYLILAMAACFFFNWRYYIKLEAMFQRIDVDKEYLEKSSKLREELIEKISQNDEESRKSVAGKIKNFFFYNKLFFLNDEAEMAIVVALGSIFGKMDFALVYIALSQVIIAFWRFFERINQIRTNSSRLYLPMRK